MAAGQLTLIALGGIKLVEPGDDLGAITVAAFAANGLLPEAGDVLVVAQKIVSKTEGRYVDTATVQPSEQAIALAAEVDKDPRFIEVVLSESKRVVRHRPGLLIVEHRLGFVMANAGIDHSNVAADDGVERVLLLPVDPDGAASLGLPPTSRPPPWSVRRSTISSDEPIGGIGPRAVGRDRRRQAGARPKSHSAIRRVDHRRQYRR